VGEADHAALAKSLAVTLPFVARVIFCSISRRGIRAPRAHMATADLETPISPAKTSAGFLCSRRYSASFIHILRPQIVSGCNYETCPVRKWFTRLHNLCLGV
jgi:hypothetical protein